MKKVLLAILALASVSLMNAQDKVDVKGTYNEVKSQIKAGGPRAIGANLGGWVGFSYQHGLKEGANMIDLAASFWPIGNFGVTAQCTYDWINPFNTTIPWDKRGDWRWAMGLGLGGGVGFGKNYFAGHVGAAGHIGIAYDFWFPMELSLDWRPVIGAKLVTSDNGITPGFWTEGLYGVSLGIRYLF